MHFNKDFKLLRKNGKISQTTVALIYGDKYIF